MVASWGYSMILTTWVKVLKDTGKTLLVQEIATRALSQEEREAQGLSTEFMQSYIVPFNSYLPLKGDKNGTRPVEPFRLYKRGENWKGAPKNFSYRHLQFKEWDGTPQLEDHAD